MEGVEKNVEPKSTTRKSVKKVCWDEEKLKEQEIERKLHPKQKIPDPKTPYTELLPEETDDYLILLNEVNHIIPKEKVNILFI